MSKVVVVSIDKIDVPESPRHPDTIEAPFQVLKASIQELGLRNPLTVMQKRRTGLLWFLKERRYLLLNGHLRLRAIKELGNTTVPCDVMSYREAKDRMMLTTIRLKHGN